MLRSMALLAGDGRVLVHQRISCLSMIELFERRLPVDKRKILAIVFEVAAYAITAVGILHPEKRVVALMHRQAVGNFLVTFEAFERGRAGSKLVAGVALGRAVEGLVRFGERPGRNLGARGGRDDQE